MNNGYNSVIPILISTHLMFPSIVYPTTHDISTLLLIPKAHYGNGENNRESKVCTINFANGKMFNVASVFNTGLHNSYKGESIERYIL